MRSRRLVPLAVLAIALLVTVEASGFATPIQYPDKTLFPVKGQWGDQFGNAVAISGDDVVVGIAGDDVTYTDQGAAYVFTYGGGAWPLVQKLVASNGAFCDQFGNEVDIDGDTIVIGAFARGPNCGYLGGKDYGVAYVFERIGGVWTETQMLTAAGLTDDAWFGWDVAVSGDYIAVSAVRMNTVYIYQRGAGAGGTWGQVAILGPSSGQFGVDISMDGDLLLVGANGAKKAYLYDRTLNWAKIATLVPPATVTRFNYYGFAVEVSGNMAVVGDAIADIGTKLGVGTAYVFENNGSGWAYTTTLLPSSYKASDGFGISVSIGGGTIVVGEHGADAYGTNSGSAFVYLRDGSGNWIESARLFADAATGGEHAWFGRKVATDPTRAVIGAPTFYTGTNPNKTPGHAYIFELAGGAAPAPTPAGPPPAVTDLAASPVGTSSINLNWTDIAGEDVYKIKRMQPGGSWDKIAQVDANTTTYSDSGLTGGTEYCYVVQARNVSGNGERSNVACATTAVDAPLAPSAVTATPVGQTRIDLSWTDNSDFEDVFKVKERQPGGSWSRIANLPANTTSFSHTGLVPGSTHCYMIQARNATGNSPSSDPVCATTAIDPPSTPGSLTATALDANSIQLTWLDSDTEDVYKIKEKQPGGSWTRIAMVPSDTTVFVHTGLAGGSTHCYLVQARNAAGNSSASNSACATTVVPPEAPTDLVATSVNKNRVDLTWVDRSDNEDVFKVKLMQAGGSWDRVGMVAADTTSFTHTGLSPGTTYCSKVQARNIAGNSPSSNTACVTTPVASPSVSVVLDAPEAEIAPITLADFATDELLISDEE